MGIVTPLLWSVSLSRGERGPEFNFTLFGERYQVETPPSAADGIYEWNKKITVKITTPFIQSI